MYFCVIWQESEMTNKKSTVKCGFIELIWYHSALFIWLGFLKFGVCFFAHRFGTFMIIEWHRCLIISIKTEMIPLNVQPWQCAAVVARQVPSLKSSRFTREIYEGKKHSLPRGHVLLLVEHNKHNAARSTHRNSRLQLFCYSPST